MNPLCLSRNNPIACTPAADLRARGSTDLRAWGSIAGKCAPWLFSPLSHKGRPARLACFEKMTRLNAVMAGGGGGDTGRHVYDVTNFRSRAADECNVAGCDGGG